jgi:acetyl-CoA C-acetyltransferase
MTAFIIAAKRSAVVPRGGAFATLSIEDLGAPVALACLQAAGIAPDQVDEIIVSNALGAGGNPARRIALAMGLPDHVAGLSTDRQCAGGLDALLLARALIVSGQAEIVLAGGVESYSRRPLRFATDPAGGPPIPYDEAPFTPWPDRNPRMADAAENLAQTLGITREMQDMWAVESHRKAQAGAAQMRAEIVPLLGVDADPFTRPLTLAQAARAKPITGSITAANAAVAADGAAFCLVVSAKIAARAARALRIAAAATLGAAPDQPGLAPIAAVTRVLLQAQISATSLSISEVMEAYAVQAIACFYGAGLDPDRVNPAGGGLARGHPIGASGAVLAVRLWHGLQAGHGLATIAAAGGIGSALLLQA